MDIGKTLAILDKAAVEITDNYARLREEVIAHADLFTWLSTQNWVTVKYKLEDDHIYITCSGTDKALASIWKQLRAAGYTPDSRPKTGESYYCSYWHSLDKEHAILFAFSSTVCRRVAMGKKWVEQEVYETVCADSPTDLSTLD